MRHIDRIVNLVAHKDLVQRRILAFLVGHAPLSYSVGQIAAWTDCARGVIENSPPRDLLEMRLIMQEWRTDRVHYQSNLKGFVAGEFAPYQPDIGPQELHLIARVLH